MSLTSTIQNVIKGLPKSLGDALAKGELKSRTSGTHVPGQTTSISESSTLFDAIVTSFDIKELEGGLIPSTDVKILVMNCENAPQPNDNLVFSNATYRVIRNTPVFVGDTIVLHQVQGRRV